MWKQQLAIRRVKDRDREKLNARWGRMEHIDRKLDLGHIRFTASNTLLLCQTHGLGKCEHISYILTTLSLFCNVKKKYFKCHVDKLKTDYLNEPLFRMAT